jgi:hypothetical protein
MIALKLTRVKEELSQKSPIVRSAQPYFRRSPAGMARQTEIAITPPRTVMPAGTSQ